jgi:hypothetical protein
MIADLVNQILSTPDGGTIRMDGRPLPTTGYFVGGAGRALSFELADGAVGAAFAQDRITEFLNGITFDHAMYVGWWTDTETGKLWLDTTTWTANYNQAEEWCWGREEIAFWDIARAREFRPIVKAQPSV